MMKIKNPEEKRFNVVYVQGEEEITSPSVNFFQAQDILYSQKLSLHIIDRKNKKMYMKSNIEIAKKNELWEKVSYVFFMLTSIIMLASMSF